MMRIRLAPAQSREAPRQHRLSRPQTMVAAAYSVLLGTVLPFICWGAWAQPGHPHGGPHFVFADPPATHTHTHPVPLPHSHADAPADDVAGQAHPDSTLVMASMLMLLAAAVRLLRPRITRVELVTVPARRDYRPRIPTPPPRRLRLHA